MPEEKTKVSSEKKKIVEELMNLIKNKKTILIASIKNIPASQFQEISKKLRGKAIIRVPKKNLIFRAMDNSGNEVVKKLKEKIKSDIAVLFSDIEAFELAVELVENKSPVKAKPGQEATEDIEIPAGPTDLMPGPAISELGALGIQIQIDKGKITIKQSKIITKKGEKISASAADVMNKLDIKPFLIGFVPLAAFDSQDNKLYTEINIDKEKTIEELKTAFGQALPFAVEIGYVCKDTIGFLLQKAEKNAKALEKFAADAGIENINEKMQEEGNENEEEPNNQASQENSGLTDNEGVVAGEVAAQNTQQENKSEGEK